MKIVIIMKWNKIVAKVRRMVAVLLLVFFCPFASSATTLSIPCPRSCDCHHVTKSAHEKILEITCFVWDIKDVNAHSLSVVQEDFTLTLACDSGIPVDLTDYMFGHIPYMKSVTFKSCKISYIHKAAFFGLTSLHSIFIYSASNLHLQIHPNAFTGMKLVTLVLTGSGILRLPELCELGNLKVLNISGNSLVTFKDAGLECSTNSKLMNLRVIDISDNFLYSVKELKAIGANFPNIEIFLAENNKITMYANENPFANFENLRSLAISRNQIAELPKAVIHSNRKIEEFRIGSNNLKYLPPDVFNNSEKLLQLELQDNLLDDLIWLELAALKKLMFLDLSENKLTFLNQTTISEIPELTYLDLTGNSIQGLPVKTFQNQQRLQQLSVARNHINVLDNEALYGLLFLTRLQLQHNRIYSMNRNILNSATALTYLNISYNFLQELPSLDKLSSLLVLDASNNYIETIPEKLFKSQGKVRDINLSNNRISELSDSVFISCDSLETLDLSENLITSLHPSLFMGLGKLRTLSLQNNRLQDFGKMFASLNNLQELNLSSNEITDTIQRYSFPVNLIMLDLSYNSIEHVRPSAFYGLNQIRMVDLRFNRIQTIAREALTVSTGLYTQTGFRLENNPLKCDCNLLWLKNWNQETRGPLIVNLNMTKCSGAYNYPESVVKSVPEERFLCKYESVCTEFCKCCDFTACDCKYNCPRSCDCYKSADYYTNHYVKCSNQNITAIDKFIPRIATELDYSGSDLVELESHSFIGMSNLKTILLNNSNIEFISNGTFIGLAMLKTLRLNDNKIKTVWKDMFVGLENLETLYLDNNKIAVIQDGVFEHMTSLKMLSVTNNFMQIMTDYISTVIFSVQDISLYSNPWTCDCVLYFSAREKPLTFINTISEPRHAFSKINCSVHSVNGLNQITPLQGYSRICEGRYVPETVPPIIKLTSPEVISLKEEQVKDAGNQADKVENGSDVISQTIEGHPFSDKMKIFIPAIVAGTMLFIIILMVLCRREFVKCWLFTKYKCKTNELELLYDKMRFYDAFVAYHPRDELYVLRDLALKLERGEPKYLLQLQHRDCPSGTAVQNFIEHSVKASHRTIVVLSSDYVNDNVSLKLVLDSVKLDSVRRLVVIVLDKIDKSKTDPVLQNLIRNEKCIRFGERWFWEKLQFYLPEPGKVERDIARAEAHPYACTEIARLSSAMRDNQAYEEPPSVNSGTCRPLPVLTDYNPPSLNYDYAAGSQHSSNIYEEIKDHENTSIKYYEPWTESQLQTNIETLSRASKA